MRGGLTDEWGGACGHDDGQEDEAGAERVPAKDALHKQRQDLRS